MGNDQLKSARRRGKLGVEAERGCDTTAPGVPGDRDRPDVVRPTGGSGRGQHEVRECQRNQRPTSPRHIAKAEQEQRSVKRVSLSFRITDQDACQPALNLRDQRVLKACRVASLRPQDRECLSGAIR